MPITDLIKVARTDSEKSRSFLANSLNELCLSSGRKLSIQEKGLVFDILAKLINGIEHQVKKNLAENLSKRLDVPKDLIVTLANDEVFDIAQPVIINSHLLDDEDLVNLVVEKAVNYQIAVCQRKVLSPAVSESLVDTNNVIVITSLLKNEGATFNNDTMQRVIDLSKTMHQIRIPLITRNDLDEELAKSMYEWIGDALKHQIEDKYDVHRNALDDDVDRAVQDALKGGDISSNFYTSDKLSEPNAEPTPDQMLKALKAGDIFEFEQTFQDLTQLPSASVTHVLYDSGPEALAICCKAVGVDLSTFIEIYSQFSGRGNPENLTHSPHHQKTLSYFERIDVNGAKTVLDTWREAPAERW